MLKTTPRGGSQDAKVGAARPNVFERLVRIMRENERLLLDLKAMNERCQAARSYLAASDCNVSLGLAHFHRLRSKRSGLLTVLRANRLAGEDLLASLERGALVN